MGQKDDTWLQHLGGEGPDQRAALSVLRAELLGRLRRAFSNAAVADEAFLEDAVQDSLVRILGRLEQFQGRSRFLTWATAIAIRVAMSELRRRRWQDVSLDALGADTDFTPAPTPSEDCGAEKRWAKKAIIDTMHELIRSELTEKQRTVLLAELKGMPQDEIARHLESNRNAVYKLTHDARRRLKRGLEAAGYDAADVHAAFAE